MQKWKSNDSIRGGGVVGKWVEKVGKVSGKGEFCTEIWWVGRFAQRFAMDLHRVFHVVLRGISTFLGFLSGLAIDFFLNLFDLVAEGEV